MSANNYANGMLVNFTLIGVGVASCLWLSQQAPAEVAQTASYVARIAGFAFSLFGFFALWRAFHIHSWPARVTLITVGVALFAVRLSMNTKSNGKSWIPEQVI